MCSTELQPRRTLRQLLLLLEAQQRAALAVTILLALELVRGVEGDGGWGELGEEEVVVGLEGSPLRW